MIDIGVRPETKPVETVTEPKPSELLRLGSLDTYQLVGRSRDYRGGFCAMGTIEYAAGAWTQTGPSGYQGNAIRPKQALRQVLTTCPADAPCQSKDPNDSPSAFAMVMHLNDYHLWSRPQIADWLEDLGL